jgi:ABC-type nitrate/sulfonate/bicarbonate transport system substrate-binding protein
MNIFIVVLLTIVFLQNSVHAADKIRIGFASVSVVAVPLILGEKRGFFREEGLQTEFIQMLPNVGMSATASGDIDYWTNFGPLTVAPRIASKDRGLLGA